MSLRKRVKKFQDLLYPIVDIPEKYDPLVPMCYDLALKTDEAKFYRRAMRKLSPLLDDLMVEIDGLVKHRDDLIEMVGQTAHDYQELRSAAIELAECHDRLSVGTCDPLYTVQELVGAGKEG